MKEILYNQYKNLFLYVPFILAFGAGLYFSLGTEPNIPYPILITLLLGFCIYKFKNVFLRAILLFVFGFFYSMSFTHIINTPQIHNSFGEISISGKITNIDYGEKSTHVYLSVPLNQINSDFKENKSVNIRISLSEPSKDLNINDNISGRATLFHPNAKYVPDSFDFARWAYFNNLSAIGFMKDISVIKDESNNKNIRTYIHKHANSTLIDSLVLGYKKVIPEKESNIWKSVGLGHVWSISGFHMSLVSGWLFILFYLIFRSVPYITKRTAAKYPALICSWFGLLFYLCISGISVATIRAFLMLTFIFIAIIFNRNILSLRNAAIVFLILFFINPFFIMNAGFQLSFAAVFGLLWFYQNHNYIKRNLTYKIFHFIYSSLMTAFIASMFTLPFIIAHFGYIPIYSLLGNIIILPIFSFAIMPLIMIGTIFAIFGNQIFINLANNVYEFALNIAEHITTLPYSNVFMPHISNEVLILSIIGMLFIILFVKSDTKNFFIRNINYFIGILFITSAIILCINTPKPLFYSTGDNLLVGFVYDNHLKFNKAKSSSHYFAFNAWREFNHEEKSDINDRQKCTKGLCIYETPNWKLAYIENFTSTMNNIENLCKNKTINYIITPFDIHADKCNAKILNDGLIIYPSGKVKQILNHRPWHI
ncbi:MAG: ComEC/Rec2 family competence protein [Alphaproteobacteria bacterium]|nr:ComEC/Rec2 family competence protein [Alphaproteobacteria bacterium]